MGWLLDRFTLRPTRHEINLEDGARRFISYGPDSVELIVRDINLHVDGARELVIVKFVGAGGRAENFSHHPLDQWRDTRGRVYSVNPPGYGRSTGVATLDTLVELGVEVMQHAQDQHPGQRVLLAGSSLGAAVALGVAAAAHSAGRVCGLLLRDPPQLADVVRQRFGWWTGWWPAQLVANRTPETLDARRAAATCRMPALFVTSGADTIVPHGIQQSIVERYAGEKRIVHLPAADHGEPFTERERGEYETALAWLRQAVSNHEPSDPRSVGCSKSR